MATAAEPAPAPEPMAQAQPPMQRAPISGGRADDLADRLRRQQNDRIKHAIQHLTQPGVWSRPCEENMAHIQESLAITDAEVPMVFERAQDIILGPALEFLSLPMMRQQPVEAKVKYLRQKMGLHDEDIARAFERIKDAAGVSFFARHRVQSAVDFLSSAALQAKPPELKLEYLRTRLRLSEVEIAEAYTLIAEREKEADKARIIAEMDRVGHAVLPNMLDEATRQQLVAALRQDLEEASES